MARSVDQVELVLLPLAGVDHLDGVALDGYALFSLEIHVVKDLILHVTGSEGSGQLKQPVGQGALAVVNMRYDAKVSYVLHLHIGYKDKKSIFILNFVSRMF